MRRSARRLLTTALLGAASLGAPALARAQESPGARGQATAAVLVRIVGPAAEPTLLSASAPRVVGTGPAGIDLTAQAVISASVPFRLFITATASSAGVEVRGVDGRYHALRPGVAVEVARGERASDSRAVAVHYRVRPGAENDIVLPVSYQVEPSGLAGAAAGR